MLFYLPMKQHHPSGCGQTCPTGANLKMNVLASHGRRMAQRRIGSLVAKGGDSTNWSESDKYTNTIQTD